MLAHRTWRAASQAALYGPAGFYRRPEGPAGHFRTAAHGSSGFVRVIRALADQVDALLGRPAIFTVVDLGAGRGELLTQLAATDPPERWQLLGIDVADRPARLPAAVGWDHVLPGNVAGLVVANEWLDVIPVDVVEQADSGPRVVLVDAGGYERLGAPAARDDRDWLDQWWPLETTGSRAEVGHPRDAAWYDVVRALTAGVAVGIDYAHTRAHRPVRGTLTGYRRGRQVAAQPDGRSDVTAHVALDACEAAGRAAGATESTVLSQRDAVLALHGAVRRPSNERATADPAGYLNELVAAGDIAELTDPAGLGGFSWLVQAVDCALPRCLA